jgi:hypothetical protein
MQTLEGAPQTRSRYPTPPPSESSTEQAPFSLQSSHAATDRRALVAPCAGPPNFATSLLRWPASMARQSCHEVTALQLPFLAAAVADRVACFHAIAPLSFDKSCPMLCPDPHHPVPFHFHPN